jgi:holin-like protein
MTRSLRRLSISARRTLRRSLPLQVAVIILLWWLCDGLVARIGLAIPGGVLAMLVLLAALGTGLIRTISLARGADWLLSSMLLFFVPALVVVIDMPELLGPLGFKLLLVVIAGTAAVMLVTAATVFCLQRWMRPDER